MLFPDCSTGGIYRRLRETPTLRRWDKFSAWLFCITSNRCKNFLRTRFRRRDGEYVAEQNRRTLDNLAIDAYRKGEMAESLHGVLAELPDMYREVLILYYLGGIKIVDISTFFGVLPVRF